jgi:hypothetical protein
MSSEVPVVTTPATEAEAVTDSGGGGGGSVKPKIPEHVKNDPRFAEFVEEMPVNVDMTMRAEEIDRRYMAATKLHRDANNVTPALDDSTVIEELTRGASNPIMAQTTLASKRAEAVTFGGEFLRSDQQFVLVNLAGRFLNPRSKRPAVRILGLFPSADHAKAHAAKIIRMQVSAALVR